MKKGFFCFTLLLGSLVLLGATSFLRNNPRTQEAAVDNSQIFVSQHLGVSFGHSSGITIEESAGNIVLRSEPGAPWLVQISAAGQTPSVEAWLKLQSVEISPIAWAGSDLLLATKKVIVDMDGNREIYGMTMIAVREMRGRVYVISDRLTTTDETPTASPEFFKVLGSLNTADPTK